MTTEATDAAKLAEQALANSGEHGKETSAEPATRGAGEPGGTLDSFAEEDARIAANEAELAKLEGTDAGKDTEGTVVSGTEKTTAAADVAAAAAAATNKTTPEVRTIIALRTELGKEKYARAVAEGEARAFKAMATAGEAGTEGAVTTEQVEPPTVDEALADVQTKREALAAEVDAGRLTMVEYAKKNAELDVITRDAYRFEAEQIAAEAAARANPPANDLGLQEHVDLLLKDFPVLSKLTAAQLEPLKNKVFLDADFAGAPIPNTAAGTKILRQRMAELAEQKYDPERHVARKAGKLPGATGQNAGNVTALPTAAQREAKLRLAAEMPPEIGATGAAAAAGQMTDAQIEAAMSGNEDQRLAFMETHPHLYARVMGDFARAR